MDFLGRVFQAVGLPLCLYVDYHSFFFSAVHDALTQLGTALSFYEVSLDDAPTPQAAWNLAKKEQRFVLRPAPRCPWWPYVFSVRTVERGQRWAHRRRPAAAADCRPAGQ
ncbi:MAG: hypothetical protein ABSA97_04845 [Verrucomicrobiia bacterium]